MTISNLKDEYRNLSADSQAVGLTRFAHQLTVVARETYDPDSDRVPDPVRLRVLNEIQHRVCSHLLALLTADQNRYPDDVFVSVLLDQQDAELTRQLTSAFKRAMSQETESPS